MTTTQIVAQHFREQGDWRANKAVEYDDPRNTTSAAALHDLAAHVETLNDDDPRMVALAPYATGGVLHVRADEASAYAISRYGFGGLGGEALDHDAFLTRLAKDIPAEWREIVQDAS